MDASDSLIPAGCVVSLKIPSNLKLTELKRKVKQE